MLQSPAISSVHGALMTLAIPISKAVAYLWPATSCSIAIGSVRRPRISPEAPVPVVRVEQIEERPGGAANVAVNLASLGIATTLLGATGADEAGASSRRCSRARRELPAAARRCAAHDHEAARAQPQPAAHPPRRRGAAEPQGRQGVSELFERELTGQTAVVLSDYAKARLADAQSLIAQARARRVPVLVDPKGTGFERYRGATGLTPNLSEFEAVAGHCADDATWSSAERGCATASISSSCSSRAASAA
jgi:D-beta-D-heptose 7-phosphate kinase/D-beta-D-heptose 1-phosphate adenosyltransferase